MRLLNLILLLLLIAVIGVVAVAFFDLATIPFVSEFAYGVKGYALATTPDEALDRYKKALEARNYEMASRYLDGDTGVQMKKHAKICEKLGKAIDTFRSIARDRALISEKTDRMLALLEAFPKTISVKDVRKADDGKTAGAVITTAHNSRLIATTGRIVRLKKNEIDVWLIDLSSDGKGSVALADRAIFEAIDRHGQDYVNAMDKVKSTMKNDAIVQTKDGVESALLAELQQVEPEFWKNFHR